MELKQPYYKTRNKIVKHTPNEIVYFTTMAEQKSEYFTGHRGERGKLRETFVRQPVTEMRRTQDDGDT